MANPQTEEGYTRIANELIRQIYAQEFTAAELRVLLAVLRYTYGYSRKEARLSVGFIADQTGMSIRTVKRVIARLLSRRILQEYQSATYTQGRIIGINKDYEQWDITYDGVVSQMAPGDAEDTRCHACPPGGVTDDTHIKKIYKKNNICANDGNFNTFWDAYPKKRDKQNARKAFEKLKVDNELLRTMLQALEIQKKSPSWTKDGGQYIPYPSKWLRGRRWEDEPETSKATPQSLFYIGYGRFEDDS